MRLAHLAALEIPLQNPDLAKAAATAPAAHGHTLHTQLFHSLEHALAFLAGEVVTRCAVEHLEPGHTASRSDLLEQG
nr:hypothetical protein [Marinobacter shengliensis]